MGKTTVVTRQELDKDEEDEASEAEKFADANPELTLFTKEEIDDKRVEKIHVTRTDPNEGYLGFLPPSATEQDIVERWGGSKFHVIGKNAGGRIVLSRSFVLAGDPVFASELFETRYLRMMGIKKKETKEKDPDALSMKDMMLMMRQEDSERRARERDEERIREEREKRQDEERRRDEAERFERERLRDREFQAAQLAAQREHEAKLEQQRREDAVRRDQEHARELEKERAAAAALLQQNNQFFTNMLAMAKAQNESASDSDPTAMLISGMEMAMKMHEGATPKDALTTVLERLPETLKEARETASAAYREVTGDKKGGEDSKGGKGDSLTIKGSLATKVKSLVRHLVKQGKDPEKVIDGVADYLMKAPAPNGSKLRPTTSKPGPRRQAATAKAKTQVRKGPPKPLPGKSKSSRAQA